MRFSMTIYSPKYTYIFQKLNLHECKGKHFLFYLKLEVKVTLYTKSYQEKFFVVVVCFIESQT